MSGEQATNSQLSPEQSAEQSLFKVFGGDEPSPAPASRARDPENGKFVRTERQEEPAQAVEQEAEATEQEITQEQPEETEVEIEGERYLVPKKIADRFIQHADYTRKTQDIAETRRVLSAERETANLERAFSEATAHERQQMALIDAQIAQYQQINWGTLETQDLLRHRAQLDQLKDFRQQLDSQVKAKRGEFDKRIDGLRGEAKAAMAKYVQQHIKGWNEKVEQDLMAYGRSEGYTEHELKSILDPRIMVSLWKASQWDAVQASKPGVLNKAQKAAPVIKPGPQQQRMTRVQQLSQAVKSAKTPGEKKLAAEEYLAARLGGGK